MKYKPMGSELLQFKISNCHSSTLYEGCGLWISVEIVVGKVIAKVWIQTKGSAYSPGIVQYRLQVRPILREKEKV